jgi:hypothetical protein
LHYSALVANGPRLLFVRRKTMTAIPTSSGLRNSSRCLDRRNAGVAVVLAAMRNGACLQLEFNPTGSRWRMSNGKYVNVDVARTVIANKHVVGVGDSLFAGELSQTWRYVRVCGGA